MSTSDYGFTYNGHHSSEFGLKVLSSKAMSLPTKNKVTVTVPYAQGVIDLSNVYGNNTFGERTITFPCTIPYGFIDREDLYVCWTSIVNWLMSPPTKSKLEDDAMQPYYYLGEVQTAPTLAESSTYSTFTIVFQCDPLRYHPFLGDLWDPFNFEMDYAQESGFEVSGSKKITLYNIGAANINLVVTTTSDIVLLVNGERFSIPAGTTDNADLQLEPGANSIQIQGSSDVSFSWVDEVI